MSPDRRTLLAIFALTFGIRILYAVTMGGDPELGLLAETWDYRTAVQIQPGFGWIGEPFTPRAPVYILALAAVLTVLADSVWSALVFQAAVGGLAAILIYRIGERHLGRGIGLLSTVWFAIYVHNVHFTSILLRDVLVVFLWLAWVRLAVQPFTQMRTAIYSGIACTVLLYTEPMFLLIMPVPVIAYVAFATNRRFLSLQYTMLFVATVICLSVPWTIRNYVVYREPIPIALEATRYTKPFTKLITLDENAGSDFAEVSARRFAGIDHNVVEFWRIVRLSDSAGDPQRGIRPEPAWSLRHNLINVVNYGLLLPFAIVGIIIGCRRRNRTVIILTTALVSYFLLRAIVGADERARLPAEPLLILLAFYGAMELARQWRKPAEESAA